MGPVAETRTVITMSTSSLFCYGFSDGSMVKNSPAMQEPQEMQVLSLGQEDPLEEGVATYSSILARRTPRTEEPGRLQSIGSQSRTRLKRLSMYAYKYKDTYIEIVFFPLLFPGMQHKVYWLCIIVF